MLQILDGKVIQSNILLGDAVELKGAALTAHNLSILKAQKIHECKKYLESTDWLVVRMAETGKALPTEEAEKRLRIRGDIDLIEAATTITAVKALGI